MREVNNLWCLKKILLFLLIFFTQNVTSFWGKIENYVEFLFKENFIFLHSHSFKKFSILHAVH